MTYCLGYELLYWHLSAVETRIWDRIRISVSRTLSFNIHLDVSSCLFCAVTVLKQRRWSVQSLLLNWGTTAISLHITVRYKLAIAIKNSELWDKKSQFPFFFYQWQKRLLWCLSWLVKYALLLCTYHFLGSWPHHAPSLLQFHFSRETRVTVHPTGSRFILTAKLEQLSLKLTCIDNKTMDLHISCNIKLFSLLYLALHCKCFKLIEYFNLVIWCLNTHVTFSNSISGFYIYIFYDFYYWFIFSTFKDYSCVYLKYIYQFFYDFPIWPNTNDIENTHDLNIFLHYLLYIIISLCM